MGTRRDKAGVTKQKLFLPGRQGLAHSRAGTSPRAPPPFYPSGDAALKNQIQERDAIDFISESPGSRQKETEAPGEGCYSDGCA